MFLSFDQRCYVFLSVINRRVQNLFSPTYIAYFYIFLKWISHGNLIKNNTIMRCFPGFSPPALYILNILRMYPHIPATYVTSCWPPAVRVHTVSSTLPFSFTTIGAGVFFPHTMYVCMYIPSQFVCMYVRSMCVCMYVTSQFTLWSAKMFGRCGSHRKRQSSFFLFQFLLFFFFLFSFFPVFFIKPPRNSQLFQYFRRVWFFPLWDFSNVVVMFQPMQYFLPEFLIFSESFGL